MESRVCKNGKMCLCDGSCKKEPLNHNKNNLYNTVYENKVLVNPPIVMNEQPTLVNIINNLEKYILTLPKYNSIGCSGGQDCWSEMEKDENGEYIKLSDILSLFSAKKE